MTNPFEPLLADKLAPMLRGAFVGPGADREKVLRVSRLMAGALARFARDVADNVLPAAAGRPDVSGPALEMFRSWMTTGTARLAGLAGLDPHDAESYVLAVQRAFEAELGAAPEDPEPNPEA